MSQVMFAFVPPTSICGGWLSFICALSMIGFLTAIIGDLAAIFGCLVGLSDTVTAITFVAVGTSVPDLFASKTAASQEKTADNSIGNVTGSNSVNVFLGMGLPWLLAAIYWTAQVPDLVLFLNFFMFKTRTMFLNYSVNYQISSTSRLPAAESLHYLQTQL
jgi:Ca2+/Na+ antiporter